MAGQEIWHNICYILSGMVLNERKFNEINILAIAALGLDVFSVIDKPVDMGVLREQLNRLFIKKYNRDNFAE